MEPPQKPQTAAPASSRRLRLLITGSNGFIGSALVRAAHRRDWTVIGLGRQPRPNPIGQVRDALPEHYLNADLTRGFTWTPEQPVDAVVHDAGLASPWAQPEAYQAINVGGTVAMIEWARRQAERAGSLPHLGFISSSSVFYRYADQVGLTEDSPIPPDPEQINLYSRSKSVAERLVARYPGPWTILRPRAVIGPGDPVVLPRVLQAARRGQLPVFSRPDRRPVLADLTHVDVIAEYVIRALQRQATGSFNLTNGEPVELYPFMFELMDRLGIPAPRRRLPVAAAMAFARTAETVSAHFQHYREPVITRYGVSMFAWSKTFDISHTRAVLGEPYLRLSDGVAQLVDWYRSTELDAR